MKKVIKTFEVSHVQILDENGVCDEKEMPDLTPKQIKRLYEYMILVRTFDDKAFSLQRQGRIGTYLQVKGQEAAQIGSAFALEDKDWLFPMYRSMGALIVRKQPMSVILQYWGGDERGCISPPTVNNFPIAIPVGTQTPHAVGAAWAAKLKKEPVVSIVYMGDGATSKADFHTGLNFAGVFSVPCIFLCENNQFAISVPRKTQTHSETIAQKGIAYGVPGIQVDGNDIFAVYKTVKDAVDKARSGGGPTLIECLTYRIGDHSTSDDASRYRPLEEVEAWKKKDPLERFEKYLRQKKILDDALKEKTLSWAKEQIDKAVEEYENFPAPNPDDIFTSMFKEMPLQLKEQFEEYKRGYHHD